MRGVQLVLKLTDYTTTVECIDPLRHRLSSQSQSCRVSCYQRHQYLSPQRSFDPLATAETEHLELKLRYLVYDIAATSELQLTPVQNRSGAQKYTPTLSSQSVLTVSPPSTQSSSADGTVHISSISATTDRTVQLLNPVLSNISTTTRTPYTPARRYLSLNELTSAPRTPR